MQHYLCCHHFFTAHIYRTKNRLHYKKLIEIYCIYRAPKTGTKVKVYLSVLYLVFLCCQSCFSSVRLMAVLELAFFFSFLFFLRRDLKWLCCGQVFPLTGSRWDSLDLTRHLRPPHGALPPQADLPLKHLAWKWPGMSESQFNTFAILSNIPNAFIHSIHA